MRFRILYQDNRLVAIDKPAGFQVHPPEDQRHRISNSLNCLHLLRKQIGTYLYPVHRLDGATSGVLLFALDQTMAAEIQRQFQEREISKTYFALVRGWVEGEGSIRAPLSGVPCETAFQCVGQTEFPVSWGAHSTSRYSLVAIKPLTGRMHQIRRHFAHIRHPLVGDTIYGDGKHNRFFRELVPGSRLYLKAYSLKLNHPDLSRPIKIAARWNHHWHQVFDHFGVCPI
jgi:tRNA pseudouridine65 synthase